MQNLTLLQGLELRKTLSVFQTTADNINEQKRNAEKNEEIQNYYKRLKSSNRKELRIAKRITFSPKETLKKGQTSFSLSNIKKASNALLNNLKSNKGAIGNNIKDFQSLKSFGALQVKAKMDNNNEYTFSLKKGASGKLQDNHKRRYK